MTISDWEDATEEVATRFESQTTNKEKPRSGCDTTPCDVTVVVE